MSSIDGHNQDFVAIKEEQATPTNFVGCFLNELPFKILSKNSQERDGITIYQFQLGQKDSRWVWIRVHSFEQICTLYDSRWGEPCASLLAKIKVGHRELVGDFPIGDIYWGY